MSGVASPKEMAKRVSDLLFVGEEISVGALTPCPDGARQSGSASF